MRRDRAAGVRHTRHLDAVPLEDLDEPISRHPTSHSYGNRPDATDDAPLSGFDAPSFEGRAIDFDVNHGTRNLGAGREPQQCVGCVGVGRLALPGAARFDLQALGAGLNGRDELRPVVGREASVQSNGAVRIGPMTKIPTAAYALAGVLVGVRRRPDLPTAISQGSYRLAFRRLEKRILGLRVRRGGCSDLRSLYLRKPARDELLARHRERFEAASGL